MPRSLAPAVCGRGDECVSLVDATQERVALRCRRDGDKGFQDLLRLSQRLRRLQCDLAHRQAAANVRDLLKCVNRALCLLGLHEPPVVLKRLAERPDPREPDDRLVRRLCAG